MRGNNCNANGKHQQYYYLVVERAGRLYFHLTKPDGYPNCLRNLRLLAYAGQCNMYRLYSLYYNVDR
jgi:hypothetical protein